MMSKPITFKPGACYELQGVAYEVCDVLSDGFIVVKNLVTQRVFSQHTQDLWHHWKEGDLCFALGENIAQAGTAQVAQVRQDSKQTTPLNCPNQHVELDQVALDLLVVDDADGLPLGRPISSGIRDQYSGYLLGGVDACFTPNTGPTRLETRHPSPGTG
jgi:hypothetical protein